MKYDLIGFGSFIPKIILSNKPKWLCKLVGFFVKLNKKPLAIVTTKAKTDTAIGNSFSNRKFEWLVPFAQETELETKKLPKVGDNEGRNDAISIVTTEDPPISSSIKPESGSHFDQQVLLDLSDDEFYK